MCYVASFFMHRYEHESSFIKIMNYLINFILTFSVIQAFELIDHPEPNIWGKEGEPLDLSCSVDEPWMWCYWEILSSSTNVIFFEYFFKHKIVLISCVLLNYVIYVGKIYVILIK